MLPSLNLIPLTLFDTATVYLPFMDVYLFKSEYTQYQQLLYHYMATHL